MFPVQSQPRSLNPTLLGVTLTLATLIAVPGKLLAQTEPTENQPAPQSGCISGYPDGTFRGDRPITRYEFAAGLNNCLNNVTQPLSTNRANLATRADFQALIERQRELNAQLRDLSDRVDQIAPQKPSP